MSRLTQYISTKSNSLWTAYSDHRERIVKAKASSDAANAQPPAPVKTIATTSRILPVFSDSPATVGERVKDFFVSQGSWILPFVIASLLAVSSGYLFANFTDFSWNAPTFVKIAYIGGACLEFGALMGVFAANRHLKRGNMKLFWIIFSGVVFFSLISALAQYVYLENTVTIDTNATNHAPLFNWLIGFSGADGKEWLFFLRSITFHTLEIFCTFLFTKTEKTIAQMVKAHREQVQADMDAQRELAIAEVSNRINEIVTTSISEVGKIVDVSLTNALLSMRNANQKQLTAGEEDRDPLALQPTSLNGRNQK